MPKLGKKILGASIGNCVHVAGVYHFLQIAENEGYECSFLGPATSIETFFEEFEKQKPDILAISYRLTPENAEKLLSEIHQIAQKLDSKLVWCFGGTKPVADVAKKYKMFDFI